MSVENKPTHENKKSNTISHRRGHAEPTTLAKFSLQNNLVLSINQLTTALSTIRAQSVNIMNKEVTMWRIHTRYLAVRVGRAFFKETYISCYEVFGANYVKSSHTLDELDNHNTLISLEYVLNQSIHNDKL